MDSQSDGITGRQYRLDVSVVGDISLELCFVFTPSDILFLFFLAAMMWISQLSFHTRMSWHLQNRKLNRSFLL